MRLEITNVRGIESRTVTLNPGVVTRLELADGGGKTTVAACVAACLGRDPDPLGLGVSMLSGYVRRGAEKESARAVLVDDDWSVAWEVIAGTFTVSGDAPKPPAIVTSALQPAWALGTKAEVAEAWLEALLTGEITEADVVKAVADALGADVPNADRVARQLAGDVMADPLEGWARAEKYCAERARDAKAQWVEVVATDGEAANYGVRRAADWHPKAWSPDLEGASVASMEASVHDLTEAEQWARDAVAQEEAREEAVREDTRRLAAARQRVADLEAEAAALAGREDPELGGLAEAAQADVRQLEDALQAAVEAQTAAAERYDAEIRKRDVASRKMEEADAALAADRDRLDGLRRTVASAKAKLARLQNAYEAETGNCPHCGQPWDAAKEQQADAHSLALEAEREVADAEAAQQDAAPDPAVQEAAEAAREAWNAAGVRLSVIASERTPASAAVTEAQRALNEAQATLSALRRRQSDAKTGPTLDGIRGQQREAQALVDSLDEHLQNGSAAPLAERRQEAQERHHAATDERRRAEVGLAALRAYEAAQRAHRLATVWTAAKDVLSPERGMRRERLDHRVNRLNAFLARFADTLGLPKVGLADGGRLAVQWERAPIALASTSERWLVAGFIRSAVAVMHKAPVAVLDGANIVTGKRRVVLKETLEAMARSTGTAVLWTESVEAAA